MPTPLVGTFQQPDLESLEQPPDQELFSENVEFILWLILTSTFSCGFNFVASTIAVLLTVVWMDSELVKRRVDFHFREHGYPIEWVYILVTWASVPMLGSMSPFPFQHVTPISMLGAYGYGCLFLLPALGIIMGIVVKFLERRRW
ncbi:hypothetical protein DL96DRAFT_1685055 [Flagelloscypha sp. PMI_526]|nr:hypothetical protein DL96DRAFT_1685055 [Flagelloscypha sp. PMI_526]